MPACVLIVSMSAILILLTNLINASRAFDLKFRFKSYACCVIFRFFLKLDMKWCRLKYPYSIFAYSYDSFTVSCQIFHNRPNLSMTVTISACLNRLWRSWTIWNGRMREIFQNWKNHRNKLMNYAYEMNSRSFSKRCQLI